MQSLIRQNPVHIVARFKQISIVLTFIIISKGNRSNFSCRIIQPYLFLHFLCQSANWEKLGSTPLALFWTKLTCAWLSTIEGVYCKAIAKATFAATLNPLTMALLHNLVHCKRNAAVKPTLWYMEIIQFYFFFSSELGGNSYLFIKPSTTKISTVLLWKGLLHRWFFLLRRINFIYRDCFFKFWFKKIIIYFMNRMIAISVTRKVVQR
jgi:hypothetical protein